ncbi:hypothetical protein [Catenulispora pinisilvae]|uniref:hypothetical protein n=1 Tax=Catenulispora pinisilvae TaxID=2705253 RepID=UPI00189193EA|nr:hypothetical protein [Catenulispora pinisilvae]
MADHISIDTHMLADMGTALGKLRDDFNNASSIVDGVGGDMGSGDVADALHDFASDWSKKKANVVGELDKLSKGATGAAQAWDGTDSKLADVLTKAMSSGGGKG